MDLVTVFTDVPEEASIDTFRLAQLRYQVCESSHHVKGIRILSGAAVDQPGVRGCQHNQRVHENPVQAESCQIPLSALA